MRQEVLLNILSTIANGTYATRELVRASGYSPNTVIRYLNEMERRGLIERVRARRIGRGRPPIVLRSTQLGLSWMREDQTSLFTKLHNEVGALWGPRRSFSFWGVPFLGKPDIFVRKKIDASPFERVVEAHPQVYRYPVETSSGAFPSLESLATWASTTDEPRYIGAAAILLRHPRLDAHELTELARERGTWNRIGFLAALAKPNKVAGTLRPHRRREVMLSSSLPVDKETAKLARYWNISNPVSASLISEMVQLYGNPK